MPEIVHARLPLLAQPCRNGGQAGNLFGYLFRKAHNVAITGPRAQMDAHESPGNWESERVRGLVMERLGARAP